MSMHERYSRCAKDITHSHRYKCLPLCSIYIPAVVYVWLVDETLCDQMKRCFNGNIIYIYITILK